MTSSSEYFDYFVIYVLIAISKNWILLINTNYLFHKISELIYYYTKITLSHAMLSMQNAEKYNIVAIYLLSWFFNNSVILYQGQETFQTDQKYRNCTSIVSWKKFYFLKCHSCHHLFAGLSLRKRDIQRVMQSSQVKKKTFVH